jgi:hypothetical protein
MMFKCFYIIMVFMGLERCYRDTLVIIPVVIDMY